MHCIPRCVAVNETGGGINVTSGERYIQRLDALFLTSDMHAHAKRFASGFMIQIDATFCTNGTSPATSYWPCK